MPTLPWVGSENLLLMNTCAQSRRITQTQGVKAQSQGWDKDSQWAEEVLEAEGNQEGFWE